MIVCVCGPESTGKSTLAAPLAKRLGAHLVAEYARTYLTAKGEGYQYSAADLLNIAKQQWHLEQQARAQHEHIVFDTDLLNIMLWSKLRYQRCDPWLADHASTGAHDKAYLLLSPDVPFAPDPLREAADRDALFGHWEKLLQDEGVRFKIVRGTGEARLAAALAATRLFFG